ncbi:MAG: sugar phosphate isomerase/epimerase [Lachnospiraceae bacterium]|jgi:D-psicose/D-tagatose/L-ribulose 3-epimerase|nr:sugar phosphate isomerase/epimerase [Lachnospiraceae bacterium]
MKHGIYYAYWERQWEADYVPYVKKVANLGFDILEIGGAPLPDYTKEQIRALKRAAKDAGIKITCGYGPKPQHNIAALDYGSRKGAFAWYEKLFQVLEKLECTYLGGGIYSYWPVDYAKPIEKEKDWIQSVEAMKELADKAQKYNITLGCEALNRFEGYLINTAAEGVKFIKEVGRKNVKLHLDTFHMSIEEDSLGGAIRTAGKYLGNLHTGERNRKVPGQGNMPWWEIREALKDIKFDGDVIMEPFVTMGGQVGSDIKIWRDISEGATMEKLDMDAKNAVAFQRFILDYK